MLKILFALTILRLTALTHAHEIKLETLTIQDQMGSKGSLQNPHGNLLEGKILQERKGTTLGETIGKSLGIRDSAFGTSSSRPVVRGQDGERVKILENGVSTGDASALSPDHSVSIDPFLIDRVQVLRGSKALRYGTQALGGMIKVDTSRITEKHFDQSFTSFDTQFRSANLGRSFGILNKTVKNEITYHSDFTYRGNSNQRSPIGVVENSDLNLFQGGFGTTHDSDQGYFGWALSGLQSKYGVIAHEGAKIDQQRFRLDAQGAYQDLRYQFAVSSYRHHELHEEHDDHGSGGGHDHSADIESTYRNTQFEGRVENKNYGLQWNVQNLKTVGEEVLLPGSQTLGLAAFTDQDFHFFSLDHSLGLRIDFSRVTSDSASFQKNLLGKSLSFESFLVEKEFLQSSLLLAYTERPATATELLSQGSHLATQQFERGNTGLTLERNLGVEWGLSVQTEKSNSRLQTYFQNYQNYFGYFLTGQNDSETGLAIAELRNTPARIAGFEVRHEQDLSLTLFKHSLWLDFAVEGLRGWNSRDGSSLPRMAPFREILGFEMRKDQAKYRFEYERNEKQNFVAMNESPTDAYTWFNFMASRPVHLFEKELNLIFKVQNIFDHLGRAHVSPIKNQFPLAGRNIIVGLQGQF